MSHRKKTLFAFLLILAASSLFRLTNLEFIEFKKDEAINLFLASRPFFGHSFPPGSTVSSLGILNPPLFNYLLIPALFFSFNPISISFYIALINSFSIAFLFLIIKRYYSFPIAIITTILMAFSPWSIIFSRKIWAQDFIVPLFVPIFYSAHKIIYDKNKIYWFPFSLFSILLIQIHQSNIFFIGLLTFFIIIQKPKINFKYLILGALIGFLPFIPYLLFEISHKCPDCLAVLKIGQRVSLERSSRLFLRPFQIINSGDFSFVMGDSLSKLAFKFPVIYKARVIFYFESLMLVVAAVLFFLKQRKSRFLLLSAICLPLIYFLLRIEPFIHYFIILSPILFLLLGTLLNFCIFNKNKVLRLFSVFFLLAILSVSIAFNYAFFDILKLGKGLNGDYGTSYTEVVSRNLEKSEKYKKQKSYQEIILAGYLPKDLMYGYLPLYSLLYSPSQTEKRLNELSKRLELVPEDELTKIELLGYYTRLPIDKKRIIFLKKRAKKSPAYQEIFSMSYDVFLKENSRKAYSYDRFKLSFEYPAAFLATSSDNYVLVMNDYYYIYLFRSLVPPFSSPETCFPKEDGFIFSENLKQKIKVKELFDKSNNLCFKEIGEFEIGKNPYIIIFKKLNRQIPKNVEIEKENEAKKALTIILESLFDENPN